MEILHVAFFVLLAGFVLLLYKDKQKVPPAKEHFKMMPTFKITPQMNVSVVENEDIARMMKDTDKLEFMEQYLATHDGSYSIALQELFPSSIESMIMIASWKYNTSSDCYYFAKLGYCKLVSELVTTIAFNLCISAFSKTMSQSDVIIIAKNTEHYKVNYRDRVKIEYVRQMPDFSIVPVSEWVSELVAASLQHNIALLNPGCRLENQTCCFYKH